MSSTVLDFFRLPRTALARPGARVWRLAAAAGAALLGGGMALVLLARPADLPEGVRGTVVFVSDRSGVDSLYVRHLPDGREERILALSEPARDPALSPDGRQVAFAVAGRIGVVGIDGRSLRMVTSGVDWKDETPAWRPDGRALVVAARGADSENRDLHEIRLDGDVESARRTLLQTTLLDESQPAVSPDGAHLVFVREDHLFRLGLSDGRVRRISGGLRRVRAPRFLASGPRVVPVVGREGIRYRRDRHGRPRGRDAAARHHVLSHGGAVAGWTVPGRDLHVRSRLPFLAGVSSSSIRRRSVCWTFTARRFRISPARGVTPITLRIGDADLRVMIERSSAWRS